MSAITLEDKLARAFQDDVIERFPEGMRIEQLKHTYTPLRTNVRGEPMDLTTIQSLLSDVYNEVVAWYEQETGKKFDRYNLKEMEKPVRERHYMHTQFVQAFSMLGVDWEQHHEKIYLPWWNERGISENGHRREGECIIADFIPMHSYETQLNKRGLQLPVRSTSTDGILITAPENNTPEGHVVVGVRTGSGHPNTYHVVPAGYLQARQEFIEGKASMYDGFVLDELTPESGVQREDIIEALPLGIIRDFIISNGGPEYIFQVQTSLTREKLIAQWEESRATDKREHEEFVFIPARADAVREFIARNYVGSVENRRDRKDTERYILNPAALALALYASMSPAELKSYCNGREN